MPNEPHHNLRTHPRELQQQHHSPKQDQSMSTTRTTPDTSPPLFQEPPFSTDPLSVLAYAGRMLDREARKPP